MLVKDPEKQKHIFELNDGAAFKYPKTKILWGIVLDFFLERDRVVDRIGFPGILLMIHDKLITNQNIGHHSNY